MKNSYVFQRVKANQASKNCLFDSKNELGRTQNAIWAWQDLLVKAILISQVVTYFERGRNDSRSEVFLIGGGVANTSTSGGELTCNMYHHLYYSYLM